MSDQITIEDMESFIAALKYSQTLVNTANAGSDLAFDFLRSYDYYGSVRMAVAMGTTIEADTITLKGYSAGDFFNYSEPAMDDFFYRTANGIPGSVIINPIGTVKDNSLMTKEILAEMSIIKEGSIEATQLSYDTGLSFNYVFDDDNTVFPVSMFDQQYYKQGDTIDIDGPSWDIRIALSTGIIKKARDTSAFSMERVIVNGGLSSHNITFSSALESREEILKNAIREDGVIATNAEIPEEAHDLLNIFTLSKLHEKEFKQFGDSIELHLEDIYTDAELINKVDTFIETSGSATIYGGEDAYITREQADMLALYLYRKFTSISAQSIQI
jgi:hypothetical protein